MNWEGFTSLSFNGSTPHVRSQRVKKYSTFTTVSLTHLQEGLTQLHTFDERFLYEVSDVILDSKNGMLFSSSREVIRESTPWPIHYVLIGAVPKPPRLGLGKLVSEDSSFICLTGNGFYHWLVEELPPFLFALKNTTNPKVLLWEKAPKFVQSILSILPVEVERVPRFIALDRYFFVSFGQDSAWPHPVDVKTLQEEFQKTPKKNLGKKVYVSRISSTRSPKFEKRLVEKLNQLGWESIELEGLPLSEQVKLLEEASVICGVHGAGLSGMIWMPKDSLVIELSPDFFNPLFSRLAVVCGHRYKAISFEDNQHQSLDNIVEEIQSFAN
jgi:hypothetical protein